MYRISVLSLFITIIFLGVSCTAPKQATTDRKVPKKESEISTYPSWYGDRSMVSGDSLVYGYANAVTADSSKVAENAVQWAKKELESGISDKLEEIRSEAIREYDTDYGLNGAEFLIALREADDNISANAKVADVEVRSVEGFKSYRGFASVSIPKNELIAHLDRHMSNFSESWEALKSSKAFQSF